jgi:hypothetical protein
VRVLNVEPDRYDGDARALLAAALPTSGSW